MNIKPISPKAHGIIDYVISSAVLSLPFVLGLQNKSRNIALGAGLSATAVNALTKHSVSAKQLIPVSTHRALDVANLASTLAATLFTGALKDKRSRAFFLGFLAVGVAHVLLTDWDDEDE